MKIFALILFLILGAVGDVSAAAYGIIIKTGGAEIKNIVDEKEIYEISLIKFIDERVGEIPIKVKLMDSKKLNLLSGESIINYYEAIGSVTVEDPLFTSILDENDLSAIDVKMNIMSVCRSADDLPIAGSLKTERTTHFSPWNAAYSAGDKVVEMKEIEYARMDF